MKLAFICELAGTVRQGGEHLAIVRLSEKLRSMGHTVDLYSYSSHKLETKISTRIPIKLLALPFVRDIFISPWIGRTLFRRIDSKGYDFIVTATTTIAAIIKPKTRIIFICHAIRSQKFVILSSIKKYKLFFNPLTYAIMSLVEKRSFKQACKIITIRDHQRSFLLNNFNLRPESVKVISNGIDSNSFAPLPLAKKNQVIFVGRGTIPKGIDTLIDSAEQINASVLLVLSKIDKDLEAKALQNKNIEM
ncbi:MAG: glycosyltransferase, partial [Candidatus Doudnabacteria bacterium]|nr:glycosyltransferase [Candidatus Doudnabacteria bacterium]